MIILIVLVYIDLFDRSLEPLSVLVFYAKLLLLLLLVFYCKVLDGTFAEIYLLKALSLWLLFGWLVGFGGLWSRGVIGIGIVVVDLRLFIVFVGLGFVVGLLDGYELE